MNPSLFQRTQIAVATALMLAATTALAADVELQSPPGGSVIVKDSGGTVRLQVQGSGAVTIPNLTTAPQLNRVTCFDSATGVLGQCLPGALPAGTTGSTGPMGATGPAGVSGPTGTTGLVGATGAAGLVGATGAIGAAGPAGATGLAGTAGTTGSIGATGAIGAIGATGPTGSAGPTGPTGFAGVTGATGPIGVTGGTGLTGLTGATGLSGATGSPGLAGATGAAGVFAATTQCAVGSFVTAFAAGAPVCAAVPNFQCAAGSFVIGFSAGQPACSALPDLIFVQGSGTQIPYVYGSLDMDTGFIIITESAFRMDQGDLGYDGVRLFGALVMVSTAGAPNKATCQTIIYPNRFAALTPVPLQFYCVRTSQGRYGYVQFMSSAYGGVAVVNWTTWQ